MYKTRSIASEAIDKGKVKLNGQSVKASKTVSIGDIYEVRTEQKRAVIKVVDLLDHRVQFSEAIKYYEDLTPPEELERVKFEASAFHTGKRMSKIGRPTKKQIRDINDFLNDDEQ